MAYYYVLFWRGKPKGPKAKQGSRLSFVRSHKIRRRSGCLSLRMPHFPCQKAFLTVVVVVRVFAVCISATLVTSVRAGTTTKTAATRLCSHAAPHRRLCVLCRRGAVQVLEFVLAGRHVKVEEARHGMSMETGTVWLLLREVYHEAAKG